MRDLLLAGLAVSALLFSPIRAEPVRLSGQFYLERSRGSFGIRSHGVIEKTPSGSKFYPLPQSNVETYKRLRPEDLKYIALGDLSAQSYYGQEVIGPYQIEGARVWFGNHYYDGEGDRGVGAFGYFDMNTRKYVLFSPPEIAPWEISALLVESGEVWLALDHFGEDISTSPGGLVRWDRNDHHVRKYPLEFVVNRIRRGTKNASMLVLSTHGGYALFRNGAVQRFLIQESANGNDEAVRIHLFPPAPSNY